MSILESEIELQVVQWAKKNGFLTPKVRFSEAGWPDRLFLGHGASVFIEFKRPGEKPDKLQEYRIAELTDRGIPAFWTDNALEGIEILRAVLEPTRVPDQSDQTPPEPRVGGVVSGPWIGENEHMPRSTEDPVREESDPTRPYHRPTPSNVLYLAGRATEVARIPGPDAQHTPRDPEGDGPNYELTD